MKIALLLTGNIRTFFNNNNYIAKKYLDIVESQNIDVFIFTENNDFNIDGIQYFSDKNQSKILGNPDIHEVNIRKYCNNYKFIDYNNAIKIINNKFNELFGDKLKKIVIEDFDANLLSKIYDKSNINHNIFMNTNSSIERKNALMCQFYKLYSGYNLLVEYEKFNNFKYDIIIRSRFDGFFEMNKINLHTLDINNKVFCEGNKIHMFDWWAIGNRFIMDKYCSYYKNISPNLLINKKVFIGNEDISDSSEVGLTYTLEKYNYIPFYYHNIKLDLTYKFYK